MTTDFAEQITSFSSGSDLYWNNSQLIIPNNVVIITTDTKVIKCGNGTDIYQDLPVATTFATIADIRDVLINLLSLITIKDQDAIIVIDNELYKASDTTITSILKRIDYIRNMNAIQEQLLIDIADRVTYCDTNVSSSDDGKITVIKDHAISPGILPIDLVPTSNTEIEYLHIKSVGIYTDESCAIPAVSINQNSIYYGKIEAMHDQLTPDLIKYGLSTNMTKSVKITLIGVGKFKIVTSNLYENNVSLFTAKAVSGTSTLTRVISLPNNRILNNAVSVITLYTDVTFQTIVTQVSANTTYYANVSTTIGGIIVGGLSYEIVADDPNVMITNLDGYHNRFVVSVGSLYTSHEISFGVTVKEADTIIVSTTGYVYGDRTLAGVINTLTGYTDSDFINQVNELTANGVYYIQCKSTLDGIELSGLSYELTTDNPSIVIDTIDASLGRFKVTLGDLYSSENIIFTITTIDDNEVAYINSFIYGDRILDSSITRLLVYQDEARTIPVVEMMSNTTYYAKVTTTLNDIQLYGLNYTITSVNPALSFGTVDSDGLFTIALGQLATSGSINISISVIDDDQIVSRSASVQGAIGILVAVYGNKVTTDGYTVGGDDVYIDIAKCSNGNIVCIGKFRATDGESQYGLVATFDNHFNVVASKASRTTREWITYIDVTVDKDDNIIILADEACGEWPDTYNRAVVIKLDKDLNLIRKCSYRYLASTSIELKCISTDSSGNIYCGGSYSDNTTSYALLMKLDANLNIIVSKRFYLYGMRDIYDMIIDDHDNVYAVGRAKPEGSSSYIPAICKLNTNLSIIARKHYTIDGYFTKVTNDANGNIWIATSYSGIFKLDSSLNPLLYKRLSSGSIVNNGIAIDSMGNVGISMSPNKAIKLNPNVTAVIFSKTINKTLNSVIFDQFDNLVCVGDSEDTLIYYKNDNLVVKFPPNTPGGTFIGEILTETTIADTSITITDEISSISATDFSDGLYNVTITLSTSTYGFGIIADSLLRVELF